MAVSVVAKIGIQPGKVAEFKALAHKVSEAVANEKDTLEYGFFFSDDNSQCLIKEKYKDRASAFAHAANSGSVLVELTALATSATFDLICNKEDIQPIVKAMPIFKRAKCWALEAQKGPKL